jgi:hypothetical protein
MTPRWWIHRESRLPGGEYTGESIMNRNNSLNIGKNYKSFLSISNGTRWSCLMKKTRVKKLAILSLSVDITESISTTFNLLIFPYVNIQIKTKYTGIKGCLNKTRPLSSVSLPWGRIQEIKRMLLVYLMHGLFLTQKSHYIYRSSTTILHGI